MMNTKPTHVRVVLSHDGANNAGPVDFAGYLSRRLGVEYPGAQVEVSYEFAPYSYLYLDGEQQDDGHDELQRYWDDLCGAPEDPAWGPRLRLRDTKTHEIIWQGSVACFLRDNEDGIGDEERSEILALEIGEEVLFGGGAAPLLEIERIA
jgi:hypothetical protein